MESNVKKARELDQYYTIPEIAQKCINNLLASLSVSLAYFDTIIEPSYGKGSFVKILQTMQINNLLYIDIDSEDETHRGDFLSDSFQIKEGNFLTIGNPPFGKNAHKAIAFFNKAATFSSIIAFILPRSFRKESVQKRLNKSFGLIFENEIEPFSFTFDNIPYNVPCVFQIYIKRGGETNLTHLNVLETNWEIFNVTDFEYTQNVNEADIAIRRVGVNAGRIFTDDVKNRSKNSHIFIKCLVDKEIVISNLKNLDLENLKSKYDTAGNPSISKKELHRIYIFKNKK